MRLDTPECFLEAARARGRFWTLSRVSPRLAPLSQNFPKTRKPRFPENPPKASPRCTYEPPAADAVRTRAREKREAKRTTDLQLLHPRARGAFCFAFLARGSVCGDPGGRSVCTGRPPQGGGGTPPPHALKLGAWRYFWRCSCPQGVDLRGARRVARCEQNLRRRRYSFDDTSMGSSRSCLDFLLAPPDILVSAPGIFVGSWRPRDPP